MKPVSRAYEKLKFALNEFNINLQGKVCADFGSSTGGFVQAILEEGCKKVYCVETSKNRLHFVLKEDERVIVLDQNNAMHVTLPEKVDFISIDVGWTPQSKIIPNAIKNLQKNGTIISLIKPHYEANRSNLPEHETKKVLEKIKKQIKNEVKVTKILESPITGKKAKNKEYLMLCKKLQKN